MGVVVLRHSLLFILLLNRFIFNVNLTCISVLQLREYQLGQLSLASIWGRYLAGVRAGTSTVPRGR